MLQAYQYFWYGSDMFLTTDGKLIVGSWTQSPGMFTMGLGFMGSFEGDEKLFLTQGPLPEPASILALAAGLGALALFRRRR